MKWATPRATLIVNPAAGRARILEAQLAAILARLRGSGYEAEVCYTTLCSGSAG